MPSVNSNPIDPELLDLIADSLYSFFPKSQDERLSKAYVTELKNGKLVIHPSMLILTVPVSDKYKNEETLNSPRNKKTACLFYLTTKEGKEKLKYVLIRNLSFADYAKGIDMEVVNSYIDRRSGKIFAEIKFIDLAKNKDEQGYIRGKATLIIVDSIYKIDLKEKK